MFPLDSHRVHAGRADAPSEERRKIVNVGLTARNGVDRVVHLVFSERRFNPPFEQVHHSSGEPGSLVAVEEGMQSHNEETVRGGLIEDGREPLHPEDSRLWLGDA